MNKLPDINTQFAEWYQEIIIQSQLVDASPTRGCFVIRPYGYALWEKIQQELDKKIKKLGVHNAYFPLLIPDSFLKKEEKHIEGFSPELAVVTHGGGKELEEPLVVRPTSETIIYHMFARWISSWRDLPLCINQWANVVRWELRTRPFIRSLEFLWQEGHTAHATHAQAVQMATNALEMYRQVYEDYLAVPAIVGIKSDSERFAGAERTYTIESLMQDGKALQMCTSHILAQSFPASFDVKYQDIDGVLKTPFCTSWGFSTRSLGAVIMTHGDQRGLVMPPYAAPIQVIFVPIFKNAEERSAILERIAQVTSVLDNNGVRYEVDADESKTPGAKFFHWELRGVPVRIEIGPRDLAQQQAVVVNRAEPDKNKSKSIISLDSITQNLPEFFERIHQMLLQNARNRIKKQWHHADKISTFGQQLESHNGIYQTGWCLNSSCEAKIKDYKGTIRCLLLNERNHAQCFSCSEQSKSDVLIAKAY